MSRRISEDDSKMKSSKEKFKVNEEEEQADDTSSSNKRQRIEKYERDICLINLGPSKLDETTSNSKCCDPIDLLCNPCRLYDTFILIDIGNQLSHDQYIYSHRNGISIVGITENHIIMQQLRNNPTLTVQHIEYASNIVSKLDAGVSGKKKKGAPFVQKDSRLCRLTLSNGVSYDIRAAIKGIVIEINKIFLSSSTILESAAYNSEHRENVEGIIDTIKREGYKDSSSSFFASTTTEYENSDIENRKGEFSDTIKSRNESTLSDREMETKITNAKRMTWHLIGDEEDEILLFKVSLSSLSSMLCGEIEFRSKEVGLMRLICKSVE